jgi:hypothetical protein
LPRDFPVPSNAIELPLPSDRAVIGRWQVPPIPRPYDFYKESLPAAGYRITLDGPGEGGALLRFEADPGIEWEIEITGDPGMELIDVELRLPRD